MKSTRNCFFILALILLNLSCTQERDDPIRIGINAWPGYEFLYLAEEKGFFDAEGISVEIIEFNSLADGRRSYERGQLDGLGCTLIEYLGILDNSDRTPEIVVVSDYSNGADVVLANSEFSSLGQLKGAKIGFEVNSLGTYMLVRMLESAGLQMSDVEMKPMDQLSIQEGMCKGTIDVGITYPPFSLNIEKECSVQRIFSSADIPNEVVDVVILERSLIESKRAEADALIRGYFKAQEWAYENPTEAFKLAGDREGISAQEFEDALSDGLYIVNQDEQEAFFRKGGPLEKALKLCRLALTETGQINPKN